MSGVREGGARHQHTNLHVFSSILLVVGGATNKNSPKQTSWYPILSWARPLPRTRCERAALALSLMRGAGQADISPSDERPPRTRSSSPGGAASSNDVCSIFMPQGMGSWFHIGTQAALEQV